MLSAAIEATIQKKYEQLLPYSSEASLRAWAATEARSWGHGGIRINASPGRNNYRNIHTAPGISPK